MEGADDSKNNDDSANWRILAVIVWKYYYFTSGRERTGQDRHSNDLVCGASLHQCLSLTGLERIVMLIINVTSLRVLDAVNTLLLLLLLTLPDSMNHGA